METPSQAPLAPLSSLLPPASSTSLCLCPFFSPLSSQESGTPVIERAFCQYALYPKQGGLVARPQLQASQAGSLTCLRGPNVSAGLMGTSGGQGVGLTAGDWLGYGPAVPDDFGSRRRPTVDLRAGRGAEGWGCGAGRGWGLGPLPRQEVLTRKLGAGGGESSAPGRENFWGWDHRGCPASGLLNFLCLSFLICKVGLWRASVTSSVSSTFQCCPTLFSLKTQPPWHPVQERPLLSSGRPKSLGTGCELGKQYPPLPAPSLPPPWRFCPPPHRPHLG